MSALKRCKAQMQQRMLSAVQDAVKRTAEDARAFAPVDTGVLRGSITGLVQTSDSRVSGEVMANSSHALYVEMGTGRRAAQPYLRPALQQNSARFLQSLRKIL